MYTETLADPGEGGGAPGVSPLTAADLWFFTLIFLSNMHEVYKKRMMDGPSVAKKSWSSLMSQILYEFGDPHPPGMQQTVF